MDNYYYYDHDWYDYDEWDYDYDYGDDYDDSYEYWDEEEEYWYQEEDEVYGMGDYHDYDHNYGQGYGADGSYGQHWDHNEHEEHHQGVGYDDQNYHDYGQYHAEGFHDQQFGSTETDARWHLASTRSAENLVTESNNTVHQSTSDAIEHHTLADHTTVTQSQLQVYQQQQQQQLPSRAVEINRNHHLTVQPLSSLPSIKVTPSATPTNVFHSLFWNSPVRARSRGPRPLTAPNSPTILSARDPSRSPSLRPRRLVTPRSADGLKKRFRVPFAKKKEKDIGFLAPQTP